MSDAVKPQMHGRDHRPGGADPIPGALCAWVRRVFTTASATPNITWGGTNTLGHLDGGTESHASVTGSDDWQTYFDFPSSSQTRILVPGIYIISGQIHWDSPTTETHIVTLADGFNWETVVSTYIGDSSFEDPSQGWTFLHRYNTTQPGPVNQTLLHNVQISGTADELATSWYTEITRLGLYTGDDPNQSDEE